MSSFTIVIFQIMFLLRIFTFTCYGTVIILRIALPIHRNAGTDFYKGVNVLIVPNIEIVIQDAVVCIRVIRQIHFSFLVCPSTAIDIAIMIFRGSARLFRRTESESFRTALTRSMILCTTSMILHFQTRHWITIGR